MTMAMNLLRMTMSLARRLIALAQQCIALARRLIPLASAVLALPAAVQAQQLGVNLYGLSYHIDRERAQQLGVDSEFNPGLGGRYRTPINARWDGFFDAGAYRDSGRNTALFAGAGAYWKAGEHLRLGGALAAFDSDTYNRGKAFIAPVPMLGFDFRSVTLNVVYLPKVARLNDVATLGLWVTFWPVAR
jgi:hypothetical protein